MTTPRYLDGNCLAGPLSEILAVDATAAARRCPECALVSVVAQLHVYGPQPGLTGRCPGCGAVALRLVDHGDHLWLEFGGVGAFRFPVTVAAGH